VADLVFLRSFLAIYRCGSMTKAAELLHLTQPAVSQHLKALEVQLGRPLFVRHSRGVRPSPAGHELARRVAPHVDALHAIAEGIHDVRGTVQLGGPMDLLATRVLPALVPLLAEGLRFDVHAGLVRELMDRLANGELDLVVASDRIERTGIELEPLCDSRPLLVASPAFVSGLPASKPERQRALARGPFVAFLDEMPRLRARLLCIGVEAHGPPAIVVPDARAIAATVAAGAGLAVLPRALVSEQIARGELVEIEAGATSADREGTVFIATREGRRESPRVARVRARVLEAAAGWS
jgi:DNA-binding transcriptional LysR family regulator